MHDLTKSQLIEAIIATIGEPSYAVYGEDNLVTAHQRACMHAFRKNLSGPTVETLREAYDYLERTGRYPFYRDDEAN